MDELIQTLDDLRDEMGDFVSDALVRLGWCALARVVTSQKFPCF